MLVDGPADAPTVLVADDEPLFRDLCVDWLDGEYTVVTAADGAEALDRFDAAVDVVLLDRRMPGMGGLDVLDRLRARDTDCRVAIVTAVEPAVDVVERGFDDYVVKPTDRAEIRSVVRSLLDLNAYDDALGNYYRATRTLARLEESVPADELDGDESVAALRDRRTAAESELDGMRDVVGDEGFLRLLRWDRADAGDDDGNA